MSSICITGCGAVSPAGWGVAPLRDAIAKGDIREPTRLERPGKEPVLAFRVPSPSTRPAFLAHPRLRRTSPITQFAVATAQEALGTRRAERLGIIVCVFSGCVNYSRRFYDETLRDPATASPLLFPETVFNAPASHVAAFFESRAINYTLVGDVGTFLVGMALGAQWLDEERVDKCLVIAAEEVDWLSAEAIRLFKNNVTTSEGAGAILMERHESTGAEIACITDEFLYSNMTRQNAMENMLGQLGPLSGSETILDSEPWPGRETRFDLWKKWTGLKISPKVPLGESFMAATAWQTVLAADALLHGQATRAIITVQGLHQHAIGARLVKRS